MKLSREKIWRSAERTLKRTKKYQRFRELGEEENYELMYVLAKGKDFHGTNVTAVAGYEDQAILFYPFADRKEIDLWGFNFERDLFDGLQAGKEIIGMTPECHADVWYMLEAWQGETESVRGMQKYLAHCKRNGVTKELLQEKVSYDGMDVMELYVKEVPERQKREQER